MIKWKICGSCKFSLKHVTYFSTFFFQKRISWYVFFVSEIFGKALRCKIGTLVSKPENEKNDLRLNGTVALTESFIMKVMAGTDRPKLPDTWRSVSGVGSRWGELGEIWDIWEREDGRKPGKSTNPVGARSFTPPDSSPHSRGVLRFVLLDFKLPGIETVSSPIPLHLHTSRLLSPHLPSVYVKRGTYLHTSFRFLGSLICHHAWNIMY